MNKKILVLGSALLLTTTIHAEDFSGSIGLGGVVIQSPYQGIGKQETPLPGVDVNYGDFYIKVGNIPYTALGFGYDFYKSNSLILGTSINMGGFDVDRSEMDRGYNHIDSRDAQAEIAIKATFIPQWNGTIIENYASIGEEGGHLGASVFRPFQITPRFHLIPKVSFTYFESDYTDYYFGVTKEEATRSGNYNIHRAYKPGSAYIYGANLTASYTHSEAVSFYAFTGVDKLSTDISNSPIIEKDILYKAGAGITYRF